MSASQIRYIEQVPYDESGFDKRLNQVFQYGQFVGSESIGERRRVYGSPDPVEPDDEE